MKANNSNLLKLSFLLACICSLSFLACKKTVREAEGMNASLSNYIYAYTSGTISRTSPIQLRFTSSIIGEDAIGSTLDKGIFTISPNISGTTTWKDDKTIIFEPTEYLPSGEKFLVTVGLNNLFSDLPENARTFEFNFQTREQFFDVVINGLQNQDANDLENQILVGNVFTADAAENEKVENILLAKLNGRNLNTTWSHDNEQVKHTFKIEGIERGNKDKILELQWDGKPLNIKSRGAKKIEIPAKGSFKILDAQLVKSGTQYILLNFSDPLLPTQNLNGIVQISGYNDDLKYAIDGNSIRVYPSSRLSGKRTIKIATGLKNIENRAMPNASAWNLDFEDIKPEIRLAGNGVILPESNGLIFPFEAVGLNSVEVEIFKIYQNNLLQFLQSNELTGNYDLERVGRIVKQKKIDLKTLNPNSNTTEWGSYALDLSDLIKSDRGALYQIRLGFRPSYSSYFCGSDTKENEDLTIMEDPFNEDGEIRSFWGSYYGINGYYDDYEYAHRDDPCKPAYYNYDRFVRRNVLASNLGIVAKRGDGGELFVAVSNLKTTDPISGVKLQIYDYTQQLLKIVETDGEGLAFFNSDRKPYFIVASMGEDKNYLKLNDGNALSLSRFDVAGTKTQKGIKGFIYGERGVWRPGDSLYLNFVLEDKDGKLPPNHPVSFEFIDPRGQVQHQETKFDHVANVYNFNTKTNQDAPTGNWTAKVKVGGAVFTKYLKVETVKPNRLKINLDFGGKELSVKDKLQGELQVNWLHGAPAKNLRSVIEVQFQSAKTKFKKFNDYTFDDPARSFSAEPITVFDDKLSADGFASIPLQMSNNKTAPGLLRANFKTRAFEKGGDFSTDVSVLKIHPYEYYSGVFIPKNKYGEKRLDIDRKNAVEFAAVNKNGQPLANRKLSVGFYRVNWRWWWDESDDDVTSYNSASHYGAIDKTIITTNNKGEAKWDIEVNRWGRYLVRVCDEESGHCSGDFFFAGYPWDDESGNNRNAAAMLSFSAKKSTYEVGETVSLNIPISEISRGLVTIENGSKVLESKWFEADKGDYTYKFRASEDMAPNIYAHVTLVQPHAQTANDRPMRMYGVVPIKVENPNTKLTPVIDMVDDLAPEEEFTVTVSESGGKPMAYTLAVVDDGLLDLTRFKTPNPWSAFYAREALGVKTWDVYDNVLGAYGGDLERILSIGGDIEAEKKGAQKANRFKPVVQHLGPFYLKAGKKAKHKIKMPNYVGSVRTMVVASGNGAYGNTQKTTPVKKPLMVLATLPRVLGPTERLTLPVNVFAMERKVKDVTVSVETNGLIDIVGENTKTISFNRPGDAIVNFDLQVKENVGIGRVKVTVNGGGETARQEIEFDVRNPNPYVTDVYQKIVESNEVWTNDFQVVGMTGTNTGVIEVSNLPPINLGERLQYLIRYPHGCIEQTTSSGFPQLYVSKLMKLSDKQKEAIPINIQATIDRIKKFQTGGGGFAYWPGDDSPSHWGSSYGGHFILEAKKLGYTVPETMLSRWKQFQKRVANRWDGELEDNWGYRNSELTQAYRLYTLALAGEPELGAMNRLRERKKLSKEAKWRLAAAYAEAGKPEVAKEITNNLSTNVKPYRQLGYSYGSDLRDKAMILETLTGIQDNKTAAELVKTISDDMSSKRWYSTQTTAYCLLAVGKFVGDSEVNDQFTFDYKVGNGQWINAGSSNPIFQVDVPVDQTSLKNIAVKNTSGGILYARFINQGQPIIGDATNANEKLDMTIQYKSMDGKKLDPSSIPQGTDFIAEVSIKNPDKYGRNYKEMALEQVFPSGWEIHNARMDNMEDYSNTSVPEYQDIRDDRVYTYFDIPSGDRHVYRVQLNAAYQGRYYMPTVQCAAMYDNTINARQAGKWVEVIQPTNL